MKIRGETYELWRAVDQERIVLDAFVTRKCDRHAALKCLKKQFKWDETPETAVKDRLESYGAA